MRLLYEGKDITDDVVVDSCVVDVRESGRLPVLKVTFDDADGDWGGWRPKAGDYIEATSDEACGSGKMYVSDANHTRGKMVITAVPVKQPSMAKVQRWRKSSMLKAVNQMASQLGLGVEVHGAKDISFDYLQQTGARNLACMAECCALLGCMLDVFDGTAHVSSIEWAASQNPVGTLTIEDESDHECRSVNGIGSCSAFQSKIVDGEKDSTFDKPYRKELTASYKAGDGEPMAWEVPARIGFSSASQLRQCCKGLVSYQASRRPLSSAVLDSLVPWTPGAVIETKCVEIPSASGKAMVARVRADFVSGKTKVWWHAL